MSPEGGVSCHIEFGPFPFFFFLEFDGFWKYFTYLFLERGEGKERERERNNNVWLPLEHPNWGPGPQPRHVP